MEPDIRQQVESITTIAEVWSAVENQFAAKSNKMQATHIMHELLHLKQGSRSVTEYEGELKKLYRDLHYYHPFEPVDKKDLPSHHTWFQTLVRKRFLDGLNQEFDLRRQLIFSKSEWPNLDEIISSIIEEETRLSHPKVDDYTAVDVSAATSTQKTRMFVPQGVQERNKIICDHCGDKGHAIDKCFKLHGFPPSKLICDHCGDKGHTIEKCFKLHGFPPGWKKGGKSQPGGVRGINWSKANLTTATERKLPMVDSQALEKYNSKLKLTEGSSSAQGSSTNSSYHATFQGRARDRENSWDWDRA